MMCLALFVPLVGMSFFLHLICLSNPSILAFLIMILVILALLNLILFVFLAI